MLNQDEIHKLVKILVTADGGCEACVGSLFKKFRKEFPDRWGETQMYMDVEGWKWDPDWDTAERM